MNKEEFFNKARDFKKENLKLSPEDLFYKFKSWKKLKKLNKYDQVFAFRQLVNIFEIDYETPFIESIVSDNN